MRKLFLSILSIFLLSTSAIAGDVTRSHDFTDGEILTAALLDAAYDEIVNEVNDLDGDNLAASIAITTSGNMAVSGTGNFTGSSFSVTSTTISLGNGGSDAITFNTPGGITFTPAATWTFTASQTVSGTWANLGTVTTVDINGGTADGVTIGGASAGAGTFTTLNATGGGALTGTWTDLGTVSTVDINGGTADGVQIGGTTATGELIVNNSSDDADGLGSQGTTGQFLTSAGAGSNPTWSSVTDFSNVIYADSWAKSDNTYEMVTDNAALNVAVNSGSKGYRYWLVNCDTTFTQIRPAIRWVKVAGVSTITFIGKIWSQDTQTVAAQVVIGTANGASSLVAADETPTEVTFTVDVSGLVDGTTYDIVIKVKRQTSTSTAYLGEFVLLGS